MFKSLAILTIVVGSVLATSHHKKSSRPQVKKSQPIVAPAVPVKPEPAPRPVVVPAPTVVVREIRPPVNYGEWVLAGVGILVCGVLVSQTLATRKSVDAALKQVMIQGEMLRPRVGFVFSVNAYEDMVQGKMVLLSLDFINTGGVPAYEVVPETWIEFLKHPFQFTSAATYNRGTPIQVDTRKPTTYWVPLTRRLNADEVSTLRGGGGTVCLHVKLTYTVLGETAYSEDAFYVEPSGVGVIPNYSHYT